MRGESTHTRRGLLATVATGLLAGCLDVSVGGTDRSPRTSTGVEGVYDLDIDEIILPYEPIRITADIPRQWTDRLPNQQSNPATVAPDNPAYIEFTVRNPGSEPVELIANEPSPFGVLVAEGPWSAFPLWSDAYLESDAVEVVDGRVTRYDDEEHTRVVLESGQSISRLYAVRWEHNDEFTIDAPLNVTDQLVIDEGTTTSVAEYHIGLSLDEHSIVTH